MKKHKESGQSPHELAEAYLESEAVDGCHTMWHVRGGWQIWTGQGYEPVCTQRIEQKVLKFLQQSSRIRISRSLIRNVVDLLRISQHLEVNELPCWLDGSEKNAANCFRLQNGMLRLDEPEPVLLPHDPSLLGVAAVGFNYSPSASCPRWMEFLGEVWPDDPLAIETLQEWFGYCLVPDTSRQKILSIVGCPRSGKSTIGRVLTALIGRSTVANPSIRDLSGHFGLWGLLDKKLAIVPDAMLSHPCPAIEELLKSVSGEDAVDVHRKGLPPLTGVRLKARFMILANELPKFQDSSGALKRRLLLLRMNQSFYGREDKQLTDTLLSDLPGIFNWAVAGLRRLNLEGGFSSEEKARDRDRKAVSAQVTKPTGSAAGIVAKLQQGKEAMAARCRLVADKLLKEAGAKNCSYHSRLSGWACAESGTVRVPEPTTRRRLYIVAREAGHIALNHQRQKPVHRQEYEAERYAHDALRRHGIAVPKKSTKDAKAHLARRIRQAVKRGANKIDREAFLWCKSEFSIRDRHRIEKVRLANLSQERNRK